MENKKKSILFVVDNMKIGGIQKNMLNSLIALREVFDITLCIYNPTGAYMGSIPEDVKLVFPDAAYQTLGMSNAETLKKPMTFIRRTFYYIIMKLFGNGVMYQKMLKHQRHLGTYDYAVSGMQAAVEGVFFSGCNELILEKVKAKQKIAYIHCDYILSGIDNPYNRSVYRRLDKILVPNYSNREQLISAMPEIGDRTFIVNNFCNYEEVREKANCGTVSYSSDVVNVVTIARISPEKGVDRAISVFKRLKDEGYRFAYHVIGGGVGYGELSNFVAANNLSDCVFLHGYDNNPYKYLKNANLFLLPSRNEAAGLVIDEARCLGVPVLSTRTVAAEETIAQHSCGWVCENSEEGIYSSLKVLLGQETRLTDKTHVLRSMPCNNDIPIAQFCHMLEE